MLSGLAEALAYTAEGDWNSLRRLDNLAVSYAGMMLVLRSPDAAQHASWRDALLIRGPHRGVDMGACSASHHFVLRRVRDTRREP